MRTILSYIFIIYLLHAEIWRYTKTKMSRSFRCSSLEQKRHCFDARTFYASLNSPSHLFQLIRTIDKINNKNHGLLPLGGLVSPPGGFASLAFDQAVPKNSQRHLADQNTICILHQSDCAYFVVHYLNQQTNIGQVHLRDSIS